jgi:hypothetical protein
MMNKFSFLLFALYLTSEWVVLAIRPDFSRIPGYSEAREGILKMRSRKVVGHTPTLSDVNLGREFWSSGVRLDDYGSFLQYEADVNHKLVPLDFEDNVEDVECGSETMRIVQKMTGIEHKFVTGEYVTASGLWKCGDSPVYRKITGVLSVNTSLDGKFSTVVVSTQDVPFSELFDYVSAKTIHAGLAKSFIDDVVKSTYTPTNKTNVGKDARNMRGEYTFTVTSPTKNQKIVDGSVLPLSFRTDISLSSYQKFRVTLFGKDGTSAFQYEISSAGSSYSKNIQITSGPLCGTYSLSVEWCGLSCSTVATVQNVHFNYIEKILTTSPHFYDEYESGDSVIIAWDYEPNGGVVQDVKVHLSSVNKDGTENSISNCYWDGKMTQKSVRFTPDCFTAGERYKFSIKYNNDGNTGSDIIYSDIFSYAKSEDDYSLNVYEPEMGASLKSGQTVTIKWEAYGWSSSDKVDIYLYQDVWGPDTLVYSKTGVSVNSKQQDIIIPSKSTVGSGSNFYFYIGYDCGYLWCSEGFYSKTFGINYNPPFTITTEVSDDVIYFPGFDRQVDWTTTVTTPDEIYVSVKAKYPSIVPLPDKTITSVKTTATALRAVVHPDTGSTLPTYYEIAYDCWFFGYLCSRVTSKTFNLVDFHEGAWNEDQSGSVMQKSINLAHASCDSDCSDSSTSLFCRACKAGMDITADATCENCHAKVRAGFYGLELEFQRTTVKLFKVDFYGRIDMELHLKMDSSVSFTKTYNKRVLSYSPTIPTFFIGPIPITLSLTVTGDIPVNFDMDSSLQGKVESQGSFNLFSTAQYGQRIAPSNRGVTALTRYSHSLNPSYDFSAHAEATLSTGLQLGLEASFSKILNFNFGAEANFDLHGELDHFSALGTEKLFQNTSYNYGSCVNSHYLEYYLRYSASAHADASFVFVGNFFEKDFKTENPYILISGCLLPVDTNNENNAVYKKILGVLGLSRGEIPFTDDVLISGLADELCKLMDWPKGSLIVEVEKNGDTTSFKRSSLPKAEDMISGLTLTLLPNTTMGGESYSTKKQLEQRLSKALSDQNSAFYSGVVGKYFKGKFIMSDDSSSSSDGSSSSSAGCPVNYKFVNNECVICSWGECCPGGKSAGISNCDECIDNQKYCASCKPGTKFVQVFPGRGTCEACGSDECCIGKNYNQTCAACTDDLSECTDCHPGYYLHNGICTDKKPSSGSRARIAWITSLALAICVLAL